MENDDPPSSPLTLFLTPRGINIVVAIGISLLLGGRGLVGRRVDVTADEEASEGSTERTAPERTEDPARGGVGYPQVMTLLGLAVLAVVSATTEVDVGFLSISIAVVLRLATYRSHQDAVGKVS